MKQNIVISAVNLTEGGGLTILIQCLEYLSNSKSIQDKYSVFALVNSKKTFNFSNINFIEIPKAKKNWIARLYYEYFGFKGISMKLRPELWLSLHDITPNVCANIRAVYCHNPTPFYKFRLIDLKFSYKILLFCLFYRFIYQINIHKNTYVILQQQWLKEEFQRLYKLPQHKIITAIPTRSTMAYPGPQVNLSCDDVVVFFFPTISRQFKNIETLCEAAKILRKNFPKRFIVRVTITGTEDRYARWVYERYCNIPEIEFIGRLQFEDVINNYASSDCLVFPSLLETWGLPISEFSIYGKPMIVADLPYAHETAAGSKMTAFFNPHDASQLSLIMSAVINSDFQLFSECPSIELAQPYSRSWHELFDIILNNKEGNEK